MVLGEGDIEEDTSYDAGEVLSSDNLKYDRMF